MKKILGLDLGAASIGWALIEENVEQNIGKTKIIGLGSRIIPYDGNEGRDFSKGTGESRNAERTKARTIRRGYDRYQLRRKFLVNILIKNNLMPDHCLMSLPKMDLWSLRSRAAESEISLKELGRILLMLNQKRGYKSCRSDANLNKKDTDYVAEVKSRYEILKENGLTPGQHFYRELLKDEFFRIKNNVYPREAYIDEFNRICAVQQKYHPELSSEVITEIRDKIIYYQRQLKSQKGLVSVCEFEGFNISRGGKEYFVGPKVSPKSSPLFQICKIWENINNIRLDLRAGGELKLTIEQKQMIFNHLNDNNELSATDLYRIIGIKKGSCFANKQLSKGLKGNITRQLIKKCLGDHVNEYGHLLQMNIKINTSEEETFLYDKRSGEVKGSKFIKEVDGTVEREPLYQLWHTIYSIKNEIECSQALQSRFGLDPVTADKLAAIDFTSSGFGNKSSKCIRKILPYLFEGNDYSEAMCYAGYSHSDSMTKDENEKREICDRLRLLPKNSLRQPVVEKILNQMVNVVNAITETYGKPDEIRIELARELKQSREERNKTDSVMSERQRENEKIALHLAEYNVPPTRNNIIKWRLYQEMNGNEMKMNAICIYCGQPISLTEALKGNEVDVEHIIPRSRLFDDSQTNKTLAHRHCNRNKNDLTAFDFMRNRNENEFQAYADRVNMLYANQIISKAKRERLLMAGEDIPDDFINRQLGETRYISKKAREILQTICRDVWVTSGIVTSKLRRIWGWDDVTQNLQFPKYKAAGQTEFTKWESDNGLHSKEIISNWTKRDDQRHHAIDALTIACTRQGFIQRFNTLNSTETKEDMMAAVRSYSKPFREKLNLLEMYIKTQQPLSYSDVEKATAGILISYKAGKKVAVKGSRKTGKRGNKEIVQSGILIPRGALSEESVYGKIKTLDPNKPPRYLFEHPDLILKPYIKDQISERLARFKGDAKKALASLKTEPIFTDKEKKTSLEYATCFKEEYVIKYKIDGNFNKTDKVIDGKVKELLRARLDKFGGKPKEAFRDVEKEGANITWWEDEGLSKPIISVRCYTGLNSVTPVRKDQFGNDSGFVKPGNNHHIAIYCDESGKKTEHVCTFWHAVERKKYGLPVIIKDTNFIWDKVIAEGEEKYPDSFLEKLPPAGLRLEISLQQNEMFILGMSEDDVKSALEQRDHRSVSENLYRVQKLAENYYVFRHHLETQIIDSNEALNSKRYYRIRSIPALFCLNPLKVKIDFLGNITKND